MKRYRTATATQV